MLVALTTGLRFRLAIALTAFAGLCFVAPPAVLTFGHGGNALHCLANAEKVNHGNMASHAGGHHGDHAPDSERSTSSGDHQMTCCGLFCLSALAADSPAITPAALTVALVLGREPTLFNRVSERLDRPPISLLIV
jgi:hypothetical protein